MQEIFEKIDNILLAEWQSYVLSKAGRHRTFTIEENALLLEVFDSIGQRIGRLEKELGLEETDFCKESREK